MNRHLEDARYHLGRALYHVAAAARMEAAPYEGRVRRLVGEEMEAEPDRRERVRAYAERARDDVEGYAETVRARRAE